MALLWVLLLFRLITDLSGYGGSEVVLSLDQGEMFSRTGLHEKVKSTGLVRRLAKSKEVTNLGRLVGAPREWGGRSRPMNPSRAHVFLACIRQPRRPPSRKRPPNI